MIGHYPYNSPGYQLNQDNIQVNGTLRLSIKNRSFNVGTISGSGLVTQPRYLWGSPELTQTNSFSGVIDNGTGMDFGNRTGRFALPNARAILNQGSAILDTPLGFTLVVRTNFYERQYGSDVNVHSYMLAPAGKVVLAGVYSYSDQGRTPIPRSATRASTGS